MNFFRVVGSLFEGNKAQGGGGLWAGSECLVALAGSEFIENEAQQHGGGVFC